MKWHRFELLTVGAMLLVAQVRALTLADAASADDSEAGYAAAAGPHQVTTVLFEWTDAERRRSVPVKIYAPRERQGSSPVIIFSHGLGGSRDNYEYLGRHWASHGYVSVHLEHQGSDREVWQQAGDRMGSLRAAAADPRIALHRPIDVRFVIDQLAKLNHDDPAFKGRLDLEHIGIAGHSFGAHTTLLVAGQAMIGPLGREATLADKRVKAAIPMSAPVPARRNNLDRVYAGVTIPCLHMTGTLDDSPIGETKAADRRIPFDHSKAANQYLITFEGGDHMVFSGRRPAMGPAARDARFQQLILESTTAFWDAYLKGDDKAKAWLSKGGFEKALGKDGRFDKRLDGRPATGSGPASRPE